jgi:SNF2 family DNA or RNA helicase
MEMHIDVQGKKIALLPILRSALERLSNISSESVEALNHNGKFFASLENGNLITMPFERIKTILLALQELLDKDTESLRVSTLHAAQLLNELGAARWYGAEKLLALISQLKQLRSPKAIAPPKSFNAELRPYQLEGLAWLQLLARFNLGGILADDMGLGKTIQILAHIALEKEAGRLSFPFLVVCPTSVLPNWLAELEKFAPNLTFISHAGQNRSKSALLTTGLKADVVLTTYPILTRDLDILKQIGFHGLALDEAQTIKNPLAKVAQSAKAIKAGHRFCLTGTPVENHLGELWSEFDFLMPGVLGDKSSFNKHIRIPIEKSGNRERQEALASRIKPFLLRRTKKEVLSELPDKTVIIKQIEMTGQQLDLYETVRLACTEHIQLEIAKKGFNQSQIIILDAMLKLRQVCCDPRLVNLPTAKKVQESAKLETLLEMVEQLAAEGKKMLIFSQFTSMLDLIASELQHKEIGYVELRGDTKDRVAPVKQFQESTVPVFLLSLKSGGVGLNLTAADTVIHYDPWWNPAAEDQATDRAYRIGQSKDVFVYKLIAHGTIEQWMLSMQERKRNLASSIYDKSGNFGAAFTEDDLANLLRPMERI